MNAKLISIAGPLQGSTITLDEQELSIGRGSANQLSLDDRRVSRQHCLINKEAGQYKITDLDSRNGTFVNELPVKERLLGHGDQIKVGASLFLFLFDEGETAGTPALPQLDAGLSVPRSTVQLPLEETLYWQPEKPRIPLPAAERTVRDLQALLRISAMIGSVRRLEELERKLLESIFEVVPADRGAIILVGEKLDEFASIFGWDRIPVLHRPVQVSRAAIDQALQKRAAVLSNAILENEAGRQAESQGASPISSLLAVPLLISERALGAIYLDTSDPKVRFDENHLQMVTAIAGMGAIALDNARRVEWLEGENRRLQTEIDIEHNMVGESPRMREVYQFIAKLAPTDSTVLICGESGTGKELVARALHRNSPRAGKPFVAINCAALMENLLESELFGHEKGAFTGAIAQKKGKLEVAEGGTVFLDEVAELAPTLQTKLLRVLQEREFERVGSARTLKVDIRLIAATNRELNEAVKKGAFRQDLYYRLNVVSLIMPPLRERREDIPLLAKYFAAKHSNKSKRPVMGLSPEARSCLLNYPWPGNVRELENAVERAVVLGSSDVILPEDLPEALLEAQAPAGASIAKYHEAVKEAKKQIIRKAVDQAGGNYSEAAKLLGVHPNYLYRLIRNMKLKTR